MIIYMKVVHENKDDAYGDLRLRLWAKPVLGTTDEKIHFVY